MNDNEINDLVWWAKDRVRGFISGLHRSPDFGYSVEFAQHRQYVPGDSPKHIDWAVLAKTDRYLTKQYEAESNLRSYFVVDASGSMLSPENAKSKWSSTVELITLISILLQKQRDALGLLELCGEKEVFFETKSTEEGIREMLHHLTRPTIEAMPNGEAARALTELGYRMPKRCQLTYVSDVFTTEEHAVAKALGALKFEGHHVRWFLFYSQSHEIEGKGLNGTQVRDVETGRKTHLSQMDVQRFTSFVSNKLKEIEQLGMEQGVEVVLLNSDEPTISLLRKIIEE
jgi:hypothetical protein